MWEGCLIYPYKRGLIAIKLIGFRHQTQTHNQKTYKIELLFRIFAIRYKTTRFIYLNNIKILYEELI